MPDILARLERSALAGMARMFDGVPFAREFHEAASTHREYYRRHILEAILRIHLNNEVDAYCLSTIARTAPQTAARLIKYLAEEFGHDRMLLPDVLALQLSEEEIARTEPFFSTQLLMGYLRYAVDREGPLPTFVWNWFVEWYSDRYNERIVAKARAEMGADAVKGMMEHLTLDRELDHESGIGAALLELMTTETMVVRAETHLERFTQLVAMYFDELYLSTIGRQEGGA